MGSLEGCIFSMQITRKMATEFLGIKLSRPLNYEWTCAMGERVSYQHLEGRGI